MTDIVMIAHIIREKVNQVLKMQITGKALKPCPFCGGNNISLWEECVDFMNFKDYIYMVECNRCNAKIKRYSVTGVKRAWNRREGDVE